MQYLFSLPLHKRHDLVIAGRGGTQQNISQEFLKSYPVRLHALPCQQSIVERLSAAQRLVRMRRYSAGIARSLPAAAFIETFVQNGEQLSSYSVEELADTRRNAIRTGPFGSQLLHSEFTDHGIPVLGIDNAANNRFEWGKLRFITPEKFEKLR